MLVREWMAADPVCVDPDTSLLHAKYLLGEQSIRHLPVVTGGVLVGIVTDRDLREFAPSRASAVDLDHAHIQIDDIRAAEVMSRNPITIGPGETIEHAAHLMVTEKIGALPVVDGEGRLVGILTKSDLINALVFLTGSTQAGIRVAIDLPRRISPCEVIRTLSAAPFQLLSAAIQPVAPGTDRTPILARLAPGEAVIEALDAALAPFGLMRRSRLPLLFG